MTKALVMGASGFLGSHVVKALAAQGRDIRVMVRASSDTSAIAHLKIEQVVADIEHPASLVEAMSGCSTVFYGIVDTLAWLRDSAPLYRTTVGGLRSALDTASQTG